MQNALRFSYAFAALAMNRPIEKVAGVKLQPRFRGQHVHHAPALRLVDFRRLRQSADILIQHPIVIVSAAILELLIVLLDARANRRRVW